MRGGGKPLLAAVRAPFVSCRMARSIRYLGVAVICGLLAPQANAPRVTHAPERSVSAQPTAITAVASPAFNSPAQTTANPSQHNTVFHLRAAIERALISLNDQEREAAFTTLLSQLIELDPAAAGQLLEECDAGPVCEELFERALAAAAQTDVERAVQWVANVPEDEKRHEAARDLTQLLARADPGAAIEVADRFDVGRDDGSLEHLMQLWAAENPTAAQRWLEAQPAGPHRDQLYARFNFARSSSPR
jgi:hypothetical protein